MLKAVDEQEQKHDGAPEERMAGHILVQGPPGFVLVIDGAGDHWILGNKFDGDLGNHSRDYTAEGLKPAAITIASAIQP